MAFKLLVAFKQWCHKWVFKGIGKQDNWLGMAYQKLLVVNWWSLTLALKTQTLFPLARIPACFCIFCKIIILDDAQYEVLPMASDIWMTIWNSLIALWMTGMEFAYCLTFLQFLARVNFWMLSWASIRWHAGCNIWPRVDRERKISWNTELNLFYCLVF